MTTIILGGSGNIGKGYAARLLAAQRHVIIQTRDAANVEASELADEGVTNLDNLSFVVGNFQSDDEAHKVWAAVQHRNIRHVVDAASHVEPIATTLSETKDVDGATYTLVTGGLAHGVFVPQLWSATLKNAFIHTLALVLSAELKETKLRFNTVCVHYSVAFGKAPKNTIGMVKQQGATEFAAILGAVESDASVRSQTLCALSPDWTNKFVAEHTKK